jgi:hypothetical protein
MYNKVLSDVRGVFTFRQGHVNRVPPTAVGPTVCLELAVNDIGHVHIPFSRTVGVGLGPRVYWNLLEIGWINYRFIPTVMDRFIPTRITQCEGLEDH